MRAVSIYRNVDKSQVRNPIVSQSASNVATNDNGVPLVSPNSGSTTQAISGAQVSSQTLSGNNLTILNDAHIDQESNNLATNANGNSSGTTKQSIAGTQVVDTSQSMNSITATKPDFFNTQTASNTLGNTNFDSAGKTTQSALAAQNIHLYQSITNQSGFLAAGIAIDTQGTNNQVLSPISIER